MTKRYHAMLFLVGPQLANIEAIRRKWDPAMAAAIPAHVTLVYPDEHSGVAALRDRVEAVAEREAEFRVSLGDFRSFPPPDDGCVYIEVLDDDGQLRALRRSAVAPPFRPIEVPSHLTYGSAPAHFRPRRRVPARTLGPKRQVAVPDRRDYHHIVREGRVCRGGAFPTVASLGEWRLALARFCFAGARCCWVGEALTNPILAAGTFRAATSRRGKLWRRPWRGSSARNLASRRFNGDSSAVSVSKKAIAGRTVWSTASTPGWVNLLSPTMNTRSCAGPGRGVRSGGPRGRRIPPDTSPVKGRPLSVSHAERIHRSANCAGRA